MTNEFCRELKRNIKWLNGFYSDVACVFEGDEDGIGGLIAILASPIAYAIRCVKPFIEAPIRGLLKEPGHMFQKL